jgi:hypothetical protein
MRCSLLTSFTMPRFAATCRFGLLQVHRLCIFTLLLDEFGGLAHCVLGDGIAMLINVFGGRERRPLGLQRRGHLLEVFEVEFARNLIILEQRSFTLFVVF